MVYCTNPIAILHPPGLSFPLTEDITTAEKEFLTTIHIITRWGFWLVNSRMQHHICKQIDTINWPCCHSSL